MVVHDDDDVVEAAGVRHAEPDASSCRESKMETRISKRAKTKLTRLI